MTFIQIWKREFYLEFIVGGGISIGYYPIVLLFSAHDLMYFSSFIILGASWIGLTITKSMYMIFQGELELD